MALPETVRVKLSSEEAGAVSITPVVVRDMTARELVETILTVTGKDAARIREFLLRGAFVSGASRFRWAGFDAAAADLQAVLDGFPDHDPARLFAADRCARAVLHGPGARIELSREAADRRRFLRRHSFWQALLALAGEQAPCYIEYSYKEKADRYRMTLPPEAASQLRRQAGLLRYSALEIQVRRSPLEFVDFYVPR